ncbi:hypothetical protein AB733_05735 [Photobacterium swingsii]|uniref:Uncharacterized protein n=1 Tax=Photobacterium swingsii TaxID=680026 RepID=A0A0J8Y1U5_9GAMM|nr:hypothetical protein [Photobacterium swingsii]KMV31584.1 hypothetical protein AB733_05735 [Photobacterium swingsii]PSW24870.1 hypothetical protein C9I94_08640 [Photobacterium swingsii]
MPDYGNKYEDFLFHKIDDSDLLSGFLIGHLVIEILLEKIASNYDIKLKEHFLSLTHSRKINFLKSLELIDDGTASGLQKINRMRNKFANELGYEPNKGELLNLISNLRANFCDITGGLEQLHEALEECNTLQSANEKYGCGLADLFIQIVYDLEEYRKNEAAV